MIGLLLGLLGGGMILGGAVVGKTLQVLLKQKESHRNSSSSGSSSYDHNDYSYNPPAPEPRERVRRFDKETGRMEEI